MINEELKQAIRIAKDELFAARNYFNTCESEEFDNALELLKRCEKRLDSLYSVAKSYKN